MPQTLTVTEVAGHFAAYLNRVAYQGESFVLVRGNKPIAELRPLPTGKKLAELPALCAALPSLAVADVAQFADDLAAAQKGLAQMEVHDMNTCRCCLPNGARRTNRGVNKQLGL